MGIGNIWRFPYIVGTNGGGAFLVTYLIVVFSFGLAFMILELAVGRYHKTSVVSALQRIRKRFRLIGFVMVGVTLAIVSYYMVVLGWIISYFAITILDLNLSFDQFTGSMYPVVAFLAIVGLNYFVIRSGIKNGVEKLSKYGVLLLIAIIIPLTVIGLTLPGAEPGIEFYLTPDYSKAFLPEVWSVAIGQAFFSLSVGMGVLVTYGSYLQEERRSVLKSSLIIIVADILIAFMAGLMIFSMVFASEMDPAHGTSLVFRVMPAIFSNIEYGMFAAALFFLLLFLAGITSSISMFQMPVSALEDAFKLDRNRATLVITIAALAAGIPSALSYSSVDLKIFETAVFDLVDRWFGTYGIALAAALFTVAVTWFMDRKQLMEQINAHSPVRFPGWTLSVVRFALPALIIATVLSQILQL